MEKPRRADSGREVMDIGEHPRVLQYVPVGSRDCGQKHKCRGLGACCFLQVSRHCEVKGSTCINM